MEKISRKGFLKIAAAAAMSSVTAAGLAACNAASSSTAAASSGAAGIYTPGTYTATAKGMSEITATVTFDAASITNSTGVMMTTVAENEYAIGYISLGSLDDSVKALKIDGAEATADNVVSGDYKVSRTI